MANSGNDMSEDPQVDALLKKIQKARVSGDSDFRIYSQGKVAKPDVHAPPSPPREAFWKRQKTPLDSRMQRIEIPPASGKNVPGSRAKISRNDIYEPKPPSKGVASRQPVSFSKDVEALYEPKVSSAKPSRQPAVFSRDVSELYEPKSRSQKPAAKSQQLPYGERRPEIVTIAEKAASGIHKIESEENRMPRALAWAKKEIDNRARKSADAIRKNSINYLKRLENQLDLKRKGERVKTEEKIMRDLKKQEEMLMEEIAKRGGIESVGVDVLKAGANIKFDNSRLEAITRLIDGANQRLIAAQKENDEALRTYMQYANNKMAQDRESAREIISGIVSGVHLDACRKFGIHSPYLRDELGRDLMEFGESEAAHMAENEFRTIYSGWGKIRRYAGSASGYYKSVGGGFARASDVFEIFVDGIKSFVLSPMIIGAGLMILMAGMIEGFGVENSDPNFLMLFFLVMIIFMLIEMGRRWRR